MLPFHVTPQITCPVIQFGYLSECASHEPNALAIRMRKPSKPRGGTALFVCIPIPENRFSVLKLVPKPAFMLSVNCICSIVFQAMLKAGREDHVSSWRNTCARHQPSPYSSWCRSFCKLQGKGQEGWSQCCFQFISFKFLFLY